MCRSSSPLFGDPVFRRFSRDEFELRPRLPKTFRRKGMSSGGDMNANADVSLALRGVAWEHHLRRTTGISYS